MPRPSFATSLFVAGCTLLAGSLQVRACSGASDAKPLYRNYRAAGTDHFYTADLAESVAASHNQWVSEGIRALVFTTQVPGSVRFHRLWSASAVDHFYTIDANEAASTIASGAFVSEDDGHTPLFIYPHGTLRQRPRDGAVGSGWKYEKIAGYVFPPDANTGSTTTTTKGTTTQTTQTTTASGTDTVAAPVIPPFTSETTSTTSTSGLDDFTGPVLPAPTSLLPSGTALADSNAGSGSGGGGSNAGVASSSSLSIERVVGMCGLLMVGLVRLF
ncbi:hypothetical protein C8F01DRAFT_1185012 [Mycena amicta]|nr:hypothetical protein C8F01DRAFT_1185012 [Mycena amicta]